MKKLPITVLIPTLNAEAHLAEALDSVLDIVEDVFILDSRSSDKTVDIALKYDIKICQRAFTTYGDHFQWFAKNMPITTPWVFFMAQDERFSESLKDCLCELFSSKPEADGYRVKWRLWFMGKPLHAKTSIVRLFRNNKFDISDVICNEQFIVHGEVKDLKGVLEHKDSIDLHVWNEKQNLYSTMEAIAICRDEGRFSCVPKFFGSQLERRMWLKKMFFHLPFRYQMIFWYSYLLKGAWRDGKRGWCWAHLRSEVYRMWELKAMEMKITGRIPEIPKAPHGDFDERVLRTELQRLVQPNTTQCGMDKKRGYID